LAPSTSPPGTTRAQELQVLLVPYHPPDLQSLDVAILGGYVDHVLKEHPGRPLPAVYCDDELIADAKKQRQQLGDDAFIAQLPVAEGDDMEWETANWTLSRSARRSASRRAVSSAAGSRRSPRRPAQPVRPSSPHDRA
jgi:hypothetical protein